MPKPGGQEPNYDQLNGKLRELLAESEKLHEKLHEVMDVVGALRVQPGAQATQWPAICEQIAAILQTLERINKREFQGCLG